MTMSKLYILLNYLFAGILAFLSPIALCIHVITLLVIVDLITGIMKSFKCYDGPKTFRDKLRIIKSNKLRRSFTKWFLYVLFIVCVYAIEMACGVKVYLYLANIAFAMLAFVEIYSIGENMDVITEKKGLFISIISRVRKIFENKVNNSISDTKELNK